MEPATDMKDLPCLRVSKIPADQVIYVNLDGYIVYPHHSCTAARSLGQQMGEDNKRSFWTSQPGILTGVAAVITVIGGALLPAFTTNTIMFM